LSYEHTFDFIGTSGVLCVTAAGEQMPSYFLFVTNPDPPRNSEQSFLAVRTPGRKQSTLSPAI